MARKVDTGPIESKLADFHSISVEEVRKVWKSQFALVEQVMKKGDFEAIRLPYFGRFYVKPGRVEKLTNAVTLSRAKKDVRSEEDTKPPDG